MDDSWSECFDTQRITIARSTIEGLWFCFPRLRFGLMWAVSNLSNHPAPGPRPPAPDRASMSGRLAGRGLGRALAALGLLAEALQERVLVLAELVVVGRPLLFGGFHLRALLLQLLPILAELLDVLLQLALVAGGEILLDRLDVLIQLGAVLLHFLAVVVDRLVVGLQVLAIVLDPLNPAAERNARGGRLPAGTRLPAGSRLSAGGSRLA